VPSDETSAQAFRVKLLASPEAFAPRSLGQMPNSSIMVRG